MYCSVVIISRNSEVYSNVKTAEFSVASAHVVVVVAYGSCGPETV